MRILLVLDRVENPASANALMGFRLAEQLLRRDHTVHILTLWDGLHTPPAPPEGAMQHLLAFADERQMNEALENGRKGGTPVPLRLVRLAAHPAAAAAVWSRSPSPSSARSKSIRCSWARETSSMSSINRVRRVSWSAMIVWVALFQSTTPSWRPSR